VEGPAADLEGRPPETASAIWAFDALLIVSGEGPATFVVPR